MLLVQLLWGVNFAIAKFGLDSFSPIFFVALRFSLVAILLLSVWRPVMSYLGGANGLGSPAGGVVTGMRQAIGSRSGVRFVEDFQSRFDKWEGRRDPEETWKVDEAGNLTGEYRPNPRYRKP